MFTMVLVTFSTVSTACVLNIHHRSPSTHYMPDWVKHLFLVRLATFLLMRRPGSSNVRNKLCQKLTSRNPSSKSGSHSVTGRRQHSDARLGGIPADRNSFYVNEDLAYNCCWNVGDAQDSPDIGRPTAGQLDAELEEAVDGVKYIAEHMKMEDGNEGVRR